MVFRKNITIAIPVYERFEFFEDAINSAINQTEKCNIIVIDNCSTHDRFENFTNSLGLYYVRYFKNKDNIGYANNWNNCITLCDTQWLTILHSDDALSPYYIENVSKLIEESPNEVAFIVKNETGSIPRRIYERPSKVKVNKRLRPLIFLFGNAANFPGNIFNLEQMQEVKFQKHLLGAADYTFWFELSKIKPLAYTDAILAFYRVSQEQDSATMNVKEVVIEPTYFSRNKIIGFKNSFIKLLSMNELYNLYSYYHHFYNRKGNLDIKFASKEIENYFNLFNNPLAKLVLNPFLRIIRYSVKYVCMRNY